ncbi:hypothetical protein J8I87_23150 [Paraburkholderia sp. LEh10]|uniref:hypothetical protein n=1 Tax=Paraburkholderia sp. LEh10 TaxID=2821353 RepID=UPI001AE79D5E|nr:hypothetical protein [Paraburkholderia sp. LEh10]MBP0592581.1 hypothetical protein [Paraburkholderia sp. LEh10]
MANHPAIDGQSAHDAPSWQARVVRWAMPPIVSRRFCPCRASVPDVAQVRARMHRPSMPGALPCFAPFLPEANQALRQAAMFARRCLATRKSQAARVTAARVTAE